MQTRAQIEGTGLGGHRLVLAARLLNVAGIGFVVAGIAAFNEQARLTLAEFLRGDMHTQLLQLQGRTWGTVYAFSESAIGYASGNAPLFYFAAGALVLCVLMLRW